MRHARRVYAACSLLVALALPACGGGSGDPPPLELPPIRDVAATVIGFSPGVRAFDLTRLRQDPSITDPTLTLNAEPGCEGEICVLIAPGGAPLDPDSFYVGRNRFLGPDPAAISLFVEIPGVGRVFVPTDLYFRHDRITFDTHSPYTRPFPPGSYTIEIGSAGTDITGRPLTPDRIYHTFHVGADMDPPRVTRIQPANNETRVPAGATDVLIWFTEGVARVFVTDETIVVRRVDTPTVEVLVPAAGYPRMEMEEHGATLPTNGHVVRWRARDGMPANAIIEARVRGRDGSPGPPTIIDLSGHAMALTLQIQFQTAP
jgi:hypothetical protein